MAGEDSAVRKESVNVNWTTCWRPWEHLKILGGKGTDASCALEIQLCFIKLRSKASKARSFTERSLPPMAWGH